VKRETAIATLVAIIGSGLTGGWASAAEAPRQLTLEEALAKAKQRNWNLAAERARLAQAQTQIDAAWALLLPNIAAQGKYTRNYKKFEFPLANGSNLLIQPVDQLDGALSFQAPLIVPAAYPGLKAVKTSVQASEASYEVSVDQVLFSVAQTFYAAAVSDQVLVARQSSIDVAKATLVNAQTRLTAGTVTKVDVDRAELALVRAEQAEVEARNGRDQTYRALRTLIGAQQETFAVAAPEAPASLPPANDDLPTVLKLRPEFRSIVLNAQAADLNRITDGLKWSPSVSAFGNVRKFNYDNFALDRHSWAVGVQLDWVIFDGGARDSQRHQAAAQVEEANARAQALSESISDDLANGRDTFKTKQSGLQAATRAVELAKETLALVRTQYEAGTVTQVDLLSAQDNLVGSELAVAQARFDLAVADLTYRRAAGTFPPK
jgi:outer membrane protein TolC